MVQTRDSSAAHRQEDIVDVLLSISRVSHRLASNLALLRKQRMTNGGKTHEQNERPFYVHQ